MRLDCDRFFNLINMIGVYKITNPLGQIYIGSSKDITERIRSYRKLYCKDQVKLYASLIEYGWENHSLEVLEECEHCDTRERERHWQEFYDVLSENGLNLQLTKTKTKKAIFSELSKLRMSISLKGKIPYNKGQKLTKEQIEKRTYKQANVYLNLDTFIFYSFKELMDYYNMKSTTLRRKLTNFKINVIRV